MTSAGLLTLLLAISAAKAGEAKVVVLQTPEGGVQPQAAIDGEGSIHLVYLKGEPGACDVFYTSRGPSQDKFARPVRVNSQPGSAIAVGTVRGAQFALGEDGRVHVAWNGSDKAEPKNPFGSNPMLYARSDAQRTAFEPQRNLMTKTSGLDGGGSIAADDKGRVIVAWHGRAEDAADGEMGRRLWIARSDDEGATFAPEAPAFDRETGACGCCGTRALAGPDGSVFVMYRAATEGTGRDMLLLSSLDRGRTFRGASLQPWRTESCPMSTEGLVRAGDDVIAAWETKGQVAFARIDPKAPQSLRPVSPPGPGGNRKHPAVAANAKGETVLAWAEDTGWQKGGSLAWQVFDRAGKPTGEKGRIPGGVPVWGLAAVVARPDGGFTIIR